MPDVLYDDILGATCNFSSWWKLNMCAQRSPSRTNRVISETVRELYACFDRLLNNEDRTFLIQSLNQYQRERSIKKLVATLKSVLDSPVDRREVYPYLYRIIPHNHKDLFQTLWYQDSEFRERSRSAVSRVTRKTDLRRLPSSSSSLPEKLNLYPSDSGIDISSSTQPPDKHPVKRLTLKRFASSSGGFGFCIRGGIEHGVGLYVSSVDENSVAENGGLLPGDHLLMVNDAKFDGLTHAQAVKIIQNSKKLHLVVRSVGRIPKTYFAETTCKWVDIRGGLTSPPLGVDSNGRILTADGIHKSDLRLLGDDDERKVNLLVEDGSDLGLMIRGGADYGLGIYIAGVDPNCMAEKAGLKAGDQILDVNGQSFLNITHKQAVKVLKSTKSMILTLKDIGRLPYTRVTHDKTRWIERPFLNGKIQSDNGPGVTHITDIDVHSPFEPGGQSLSSRHHKTGYRKNDDHRATEPSKFHHGIAGSQVLYNGGLPCHKNLVTEQARLVLKENELGTMKYYLDEYSKGFINVSDLVLALFDLLNTPAKMSLITEIRGSITPKDIDKFDDLVLRKEVEIMKNYRFLGDHIPEDRLSLHSNSSSVSSFSGKESSLDQNSAKGSLDGSGSRPITPPRVPEVLPLDAKVTADKVNEFDVYEATLTFADEEDQTLLESEFQGLPDVLTISRSSLDENIMAAPTRDNSNVNKPLLTSTPMEKEMGTSLATMGDSEGISSTKLKGDSGSLSPSKTIVDSRTLFQTRTQEDRVTGSSTKTEGDGGTVSQSRASEDSGTNSPTKTKGEATSSVQVGDNVRCDYDSNNTLKEKNNRRSAPIVHMHSNGNIDSSGRKENLPPPPAHLLSDNSLSPSSTSHGSSKPSSPESNPFIFPSKYQAKDSMLDCETSVQQNLYFSINEQPTKLHNENNARDEMGRKQKLKSNCVSVEKQNNAVSSQSSEDDLKPEVDLKPEDELRPEVSKLAGRKRFASWGTDMQTHVESELKNRTDKLNSLNRNHNLRHTTTRDQNDSLTQNDLGNSESDVLLMERDSSGQGSANVQNMVHLYNQLNNSNSRGESASPEEGGRSSVAKNRMSWDGVRNSAELTTSQNVCRSEKKRENTSRSTSDSNLMNLPKDQLKDIQTKHRASQELYELHLQSKAKGREESFVEENITNKGKQIILENRNGTETITVNGELYDKRPSPVNKSKFQDGGPKGTEIFEIDKSLGLPLGLTIQGGSDTANEITVKSVKEGNFAAWKCGKLRIGQVLLQINDTVLHGMTSGMAVLTLRQAFASVDSNVLTLVVKNA